MSTLKKILNLILTISFVISLFHFSESVETYSVQQEEKLNESERLVCGISFEPPKYPGGDKAMLDFIYRNIKWPKISREELHFSGSMIVIRFVVDKNGFPSDYRVLRSLQKDFDKSALQTIKLIKKWKPGRDHTGRPVKSEMYIPVRIRFE